MKQIFRLWAKALGAKEGTSDKEANTVAIIRTFIFLTYLITNVFLIANVMHHW